MCQSLWWRKWKVEMETRGGRISRSACLISDSANGSGNIGTILPKARRGWAIRPPLSESSSTKGTQISGKRKEGKIVTEMCMLIDVFVRQREKVINIEQRMVPLKFTRVLTMFRWGGRDKWWLSQNKWNFRAKIWGEITIFGVENAMFSQLLILFHQPRVDRRYGSKMSSNLRDKQN